MYVGWFKASFQAFRANRVLLIPFPMVSIRCDAYMDISTKTKGIPQCLPSLPLDASRNDACADIWTEDVSKSA